MTETDRAEVVEKLTRELAETDQKLAAVKAEVAALEHERRQLDLALTALRGLQSPKLPVVATSSGPVAILNLTRTTAPATLPEHAKAILREAGHPLHVKDIITRLQKRGIGSNRTPQQVRASLVPALDRHKPMFVKVAKATYGLTEQGE
jgi:hypothetical protein